MARPIKDIAASVHQRLLNMARETRRPFGELLQYYAMERFLYRLFESPHAKKFLLKGALMLAAWKSPVSRPTKDIDLLGRIENDIDSIAAIARNICLQKVEPDGIVFDADSIRAERITEEAEYEGVRVRFKGRLGRARVAMQLDVGFGDVVVPPGRKIVYPTLLDFPAPRLCGYSRESTIAEKFETMVKLGELNSRMRDFYDIWLLSQQFDFKGQLLSKAIERTFSRRGRELPVKLGPLVKALIEDDPKETQWRGFIRKSRLGNAPEEFREVVVSIVSFIEPVLKAVAKGSTFNANWTAPGPWSGP